MMEGFADLLTDAFSEGSVPSFSTGDLDFESLCFDEKSEKEQDENPTTENDEARLQEASAEGAALVEGPTADALNSDENAYKEQSDEENDEEGLNGVRFTSETPEDDECPSSGGEEERSDFCSARDEEEEAESPEEEDDTLKLIYKTVDGILEDEDSEILEDADELQVLQEDAHSDEEEDACRNENIAESPESEGEQQVEQDSSESDYEGVKTEEKEKPGTVDTADSGLEFSCMSLQNLQDLISEVDGEVYEEKMSDFTGDEHQEAGESFADYPSDFSSGEYGRNAARSASPRPREEEGPERAVTESVWSHGSAEAGSGKEEEFLFSRDIEVNVEKMMMSLYEAAGDEAERKAEHLLRGTSFDDEEKTSESDSYSSSDDEEPPRRSSDVFSHKSRTRLLEDDTNLEDIKSLGASCSDDRSFGRDRCDPAEFLSSELGALETKTFLYEFFMGQEDTDGTESPNSGRNQCPDQDVNSYSVVQKKDSIPASPFVQGSIDDSFFFDSEPNDFTDDGQQEDEEEEEEEDEYEERRNFEQMKQRIEAFKKFYDNSDYENGREERQIKVQFCEDPLSQVNYYETDSDRDSISSSSDGEEDRSSEEQSDDKEEDLNPAEHSEDKEEDLNPAEHSEDKEEDLNPAEHSEDKEEDLNPAEHSEDKEEDLNPAEHSEDKEEDLNPAEHSEDKEEDLNPAEHSEDKEEDLNPAELSDDKEEDLNSGDQFEDEEEDSSSSEQSDEPQEPEEDQDIKSVFDPPIIQQHQSPADVVDTQTCTATRRSFSTLKMIVTLVVLTATGLMMFSLTTDQPDWLTQFLFF